MAYFAPIFDNVIVGVDVGAAVVDAVHPHPSATGTTAEAARKLAGITGGELFGIAPATPYTDADLDWHDKQSRSSVEMNDPPDPQGQKGEYGRLRGRLYQLSHWVWHCADDDFYIEVLCYGEVASDAADTRTPAPMPAWPRKMQDSGAPKRHWNFSRWRILRQKTR